MKELTREEILQLPTGTDFIIWNPLTKQLKVETTSPTDIAHNKHCYSGLKFYIKINEVEHE